MARLSSIAEYGFSPLPGPINDPTYVARAIASYIAPAPAGTRFLDPCAGEGVAASIICKQLGIQPENIWLNEYTEERAHKCSQYTKNPVLTADGKAGLQAAKFMFTLAYVNPPFDDDSAAQKGNEESSRIEWKFFDRIVDKGRWIQAGGIMVMVAPKSTFMKVALCNHLARWYEKLVFTRIPDSAKYYIDGTTVAMPADTLVIIGEVRDIPRDRMAVLRLGPKVLEKVKSAQDITIQDTPTYKLPVPEKIRKLVWRDGLAASPQAAIEDLISMGGAWASKRYKATMKEARKPRQRLYPLFPLTKVQAVFGVAAGRINGQSVNLFGKKVMVKGFTKEEEYQYKEKRTGSDGKDEIWHHSITRRTPFVTTVDEETGKILMFSGDAGLKTLMDGEGNTQEIIDAVERSSPPRYAMTVPAEWRAIIDTVYSRSGRHLPGYPVGFIDMQRHAIAATVTGFTKSEQGKYAAWRDVIFSGEMGVGKSSISRAVAEVLFRAFPTNDPYEPYRILYIAPNHLIGDRASVEKHYELVKKGKATQEDLFEVAPIMAEWLDLGDWIHAEILETPAQVSQFYKNPSKSYLLALSPEERARELRPRVGFISLSKASLGSGWYPAGVVTPPAPQVKDVPKSLPENVRVERMNFRMDLYKRVFDRDQTLYEAAIEARKDAKKAQKEASANGDDVTTTRTKLPAGVSPRTIKRDRMFRAGTAWTPAKKGPIVGGKPTTHLLKAVDVRWHWDTVQCPRCGNAIRDRQGNLVNTESWKPSGISECVYCGERLGSYDRSQDNVSDRSLAVFNFPPAENTEDIPWGQKPRSNPRMALAEFIVRRYHGKTDLVIGDEVHLNKGKDTTRGALYGSLVQASKRSLSMTGTFYGGKASTVFALMYRLGNPVIKSLFEWDQEIAFIERMGVMDTITKTRTEDTRAKVFSSKEQKPRVTKVERAGVTAELAEIIQSQAVTLLLKQMGFRMPKYSEGIQYLSVPPELAYDYNKMINKGKEIIKKPGGRDAMGSYLQTGLTYALMPWKPGLIRSRNQSDGFLLALAEKSPEEIEELIRAGQVPGMYLPPEYPQDMMLPHHEWLADYIMRQKSRGRRVLLFVQHTGKLDIIPDIVGKVTQLCKDNGVDVKMAVLRSQIPGSKRVAWFSNQVRSGTDVVLCHPKLVETGLNLIDWPSVVFLEPTYEIATALQSRRRPFRPTQTQPVEVTWLAYENTMLSQAVAVVGQKAMAAALLAGDDLTSGLLQFNQSMSLMKALADAAIGKEQIDESAAAAQMAQVAAQVASDAQEGASGLVGNFTIEKAPEPSDEALLMEMLTAPPTEVLNLAAEDLAMAERETETFDVAVEEDVHIVENRFGRFVSLSNVTGGNNKARQKYVSKYFGPKKSDDVLQAVMFDD